MKILYFTLLISCSALADSYYPTTIPSRVFGSDQGVVGSCMGDAIVTSLEHKLAATGGDFKISLHHIHNFNWKDQDRSTESINLNMTPTSIQLVNKYGGIVPDYILPEDTEGVDMTKLNPNRPPIETIGIYSNALPPENYSYRNDSYTFTPGYRNSRSFNDLMSAVKNKQAVTISIEGIFLYKFNPFTGLLMEDYRATADILESTDHSVAVVGYDDELQGFVVRNSWNDLSAINNINRIANDDEKVQLKKFRYKISKKNLPGYYLFPYQYLKDLADRKIGGFNIQFLDYGKFANSYSENLAKIEVINSIYSCNKLTVYRGLKALKYKYEILENNSADSQEYKDALKYIRQIIYKQMSINNNLLPFAKLARLKDGSVDRVKEFYQGKFINYYCGQSSKLDSFWPLEGKDKFVSEEKFKRFLSDLSKDRNNLMLWFEFLKYLSNNMESK